MQSKSDTTKQPQGMTVIPTLTTLRHKSPFYTQNTREKRADQYGSRKDAFLFRFNLKFERSIRQIVPALCRVKISFL